MPTQKNESNKERIMLVAGGTGGHVFPALAMAWTFHEMGHPVSIITDDRGCKYLGDLPKNCDLLNLNLGRSPGKNPLKVLLFSLRLFWGWVRSFLFMLQHRPKKVIGFGGFPAFPGLLAALSLGRPIIIHEQNALMGRVNLFFAPFAKKILTAMPVNSKHPVEVIGMPVRSVIEETSLKVYNAPEEDDIFHLVILGGSQGTAFFSQIIPKALSSLPPQALSKLKVIQQVRVEDLADVGEQYEQLGLSAYNIAPFFGNVAGLLESAHLVISRAGALSLAEIIVTKRPALFVPLPTAKDDHQRMNAELVTDVGGGWMMLQDEATPETVTEFLQDILEHPEKLNQASERLSQLSRKNVREKFASLVLNV